MTEAELQAEVERQLEAAGVIWHHCPRPELCRGARGWPDLAGYAGAPFAFELKSEDGRRSRAQERVARAVVESGSIYRLYRPSSLASIPDDLRRLT